MTIAQWLERHAQFSPNKVALQFEQQIVTYASLANTVENTAQTLKSQLGVGRGDRVAVLGYNSPEVLALLFACARLGAMLVPLNWRLATPEHLFILKDAAVKALFLEATFANVIPPVHSALPQCQIVGLDFLPPQGWLLADLLNAGTGDSANPHSTLAAPLLIVYTSGTTGHPKGAVLTQEALQWNAINSQHMHNLTSNDHVLTNLPLFHVGGLNIQTTPALHCGATVTLHRRFHPEQTLAAIHSERPTLTVLVPTMLQACINSPNWPTTDLSSLRIVTTGSTTVPPQLVDAFRHRGICVLEVYGATETGPLAIYQRPDSDFSKRGSTGLPALHCQVCVTDEEGNALPVGHTGELLVKGPNVLFEYWGNEVATAAALRNGWYHTGDIGYCDDQGYYYIVDRKKNMIKSGGESVYPAEVERVLFEYPGVAEAAVIGIPDEKWQEIPVALVVAAPDAKVEEEALRNFALTQLARYKVPQQIRFVDALPKNAMGKVQHFLLKEQWRHLVTPR